MCKIGTNPEIASVRDQDLCSYQKHDNIEGGNAKDMANPLSYGSDAMCAKLSGEVITQQLLP